MFNIMLLKFIKKFCTLSIIALSFIAKGKHFKIIKMTKNSLNKINNFYLNKNYFKLKSKQSK